MIFDNNQTIMLKKVESRLENHSQNMKGNPQIALVQFIPKQIDDCDIGILMGFRTKMIQFLSLLKEQRPQDQPFLLSPQIRAYSPDICNGSIDGPSILKLVEKRLDKMKIYRKEKKNWGKQDATLLAWLVQYTYGLSSIAEPEKMPFQIWEQISEYIPGTIAQQCMFKWLSMRYNRVTQNRWSQKEEELLRQIVRNQDNKYSQRSLQHKTENPRNWKRISRLLYLQNEQPKKVYRNGKQCQQRWYNFLKDDIQKGSWNLEEDFILLSLLKLKNNKRWKEYLQDLPGRTQNAIKNRFSLIVNRYRAFNQKISELSIIDLHLNYLENTLKEVDPSKYQLLTNYKEIIRKTESSKNLTEFELFQADEDFNMENKSPVLSNSHENCSVERNKQINIDKIRHGYHISEPLNSERIATILKNYENQLSYREEFITIKKPDDLDLIQEEIHNFLEDDCNSNPSGSYIDYIPTRKIKNKKKLCVPKKEQLLTAMKPRKRDTLT